LPLSLLQGLVCSEHLAAEEALVIRVLFGIFLVGHGIGHVSWFLAGFVPTFGQGQERHPPLYSDAVPATGAVGKIIGITALVVAVAFLVGGIGFFQDADWWKPVIGGAVAASTVVALVWWNPAGLVSALALGANVGIAMVTFFPLGEDLIASCP
jgi:hypothetical protein